MKRPRQYSTEPDLVSGTVVFNPDPGFLSQQTLIAAPPGHVFNRKDVVVVSIDDVTGDFPYGFVVPSGGIGVAGEIEINLFYSGAPFAANPMHVNYMVLPGDSTP